MPKHEQYEELSTLAMIGEASAAELKDLKEHLEHCSDCRQEYFEFVQFVLPQLSLAADSQPVQEVTPEEREVIRSDFLAKATNAGIHFSSQAIAGSGSSIKHAHLSIQKPSALFRSWFRFALTAGLSAVLVGGAYILGRTSGPRMVADSADPFQKPSEPPPTIAASLSSPKSNASMAEVQLTGLRKDLSEMTARLEQTEATLDASLSERATLQAQIVKQNTLLKQADDEKQSSEQAHTELEGQLEKLRQRESSLEADYANHVATIVELTDKVNQQKKTAEQEQQLATKDSDVRELMASRNLHIVDVFDTDTGGKTKPIFGRVFFTENKQLVFYAYDLREFQGHDTKIDYHVWGQKEGPRQLAKSLGTFRPDDKRQGRWIFKSDDEKLLAQIDSIFVTIEKTDSPKADPKGQKLMYAYLRDRPNHP